MDEPRYPIGMQTFSELIEEGYTYVDKTSYIKPLLNKGKFIFLSRPRRFGKSLLLSTLQAYFEGRRELFKGLAADTMDLDWTPSTVLRFDLNAEDFSREGALELHLDWFLRRYEAIYGRCPEDATLSQRFRQLIEAAYKQTGQKVVILVDEYDKPLLAVEENRPLFERNQQTLKGFFGNLKTMDEYIRFAFITGVARFSKVSIFSDLNNLKDISFDNSYADICGWTESEVIEYFSWGIKKLAEEREESFDTTLDALRGFYDGYLFAPRGSRLYNPFSVLNALDSKEIEPYWFETGTPTFLAKRFREIGIDPRKINDVVAAKEDLVAVGPDMTNPIPLMFQTGYLTIGKAYPKSDLLELRFPNKEVELGFFKHLLPLYAPILKSGTGPFDFARFKMDLVKGDIEEFMRRLATLMKGLPGETHNESAYQAITYMLSLLCGTEVIAEHHSYKGHSDIEVVTDRFIYLFEFKYNRSVKEAMDQINDRDYPGRFAMDHRTVFLIAANFNEKKDARGLDYEIVEWRKE